MRQIFEEYGRTIIAVIASISVLALIFSGVNFFEVLGSSVEVDSGDSYIDGEYALNSAVLRDKPTSNFNDVDLHIYKNTAFRPLEGVKFTDADGNAVNGVVLSILFFDSDGNQTEYIEYYNSSEDVVILNPDHYLTPHLKCNTLEFIEQGNRLMIGSEESYHLPGVVVVTYSATDCENQVSIVQKTFVIDNKVVS